MFCLHVILHLIFLLLLFGVRIFLTFFVFFVSSSSFSMFSTCSLLFLVSLSYFLTSSSFRLTHDLIFLMCSLFLYFRVFSQNNLLFFLLRSSFRISVFFDVSFSFVFSICSCSLALRTDGGQTDSRQMSGFSGGLGPDVSYWNRVSVALRAQTLGCNATNRSAGLSAAKNRKCKNI